MEHYKEREEKYIQWNNSPPIPVNDEKLKVLTNLANTFNNFFVAVTEHLTLNKWGKDMVSLF